MTTGDFRKAYVGHPFIAISVLDMVFLMGTFNKEYKDV